MGTYLIKSEIRGKQEQYSGMDRSGQFGLNPIQCSKAWFAIARHYRTRRAWLPFPPEFGKRLVKTNRANRSRVIGTHLFVLCSTEASPWLEARFITGELHPPISKKEGGLDIDLEEFTGKPVVIDPGIPAPLKTDAIDSLTIKQNDAPG